MASLAKTNKAFQRLHRERHQPESRKRFGYLEKKKDYKTRALDHQKKVETINKLKEKAANKNPNEFVFHMINSGLVNGRHYEKRKDNENVKEIVSKNVKFLNWKRGIELKKIDKLQAELHFINASEEPINKKIVFKEQGPKKKLKAIEIKNSSKSKKKSSTSEKQSTESVNQPIEANIKLNKKIISGIAKEKTRSYANLMKRIEREKKLRDLIVKNDFSLKKRPNSTQPKRFSDGANDEDDDEQLDKQLRKKIKK